MGWGELNAWIKAMNRELTADEVTVDSWKGADQDAWWIQARRERAELQAR